MSVVACIELREGAGGPEVLDAFLAALDEHPRLRVALRLSGALLFLDSDPTPPRVHDLRRQVKDGRIQPIWGSMWGSLPNAFGRQDTVEQFRAGMGATNNLFGQAASLLWVDGSDCPEWMADVALELGADALVASAAGLATHARGNSWCSLPGERGAVGVLLAEEAPPGKPLDGAALRFSIHTPEHAAQLPALLRQLDQLGTELPVTSRGRSLPFSKCWPRAQVFPQLLDENWEWCRYRERLLALCHRVDRLLESANQAVWSGQDGGEEARKRAENLRAGLHMLQGDGGLGQNPSVFFGLQNRQSRWEKLLAYEAAIPGEGEVPWRDEDRDGDGVPELHIEVPELRLTLTPARGGVLTDLDFPLDGQRIANGVRLEPELCARADIPEDLRAWAQTPEGRPKGIGADVFLHPETGFGEFLEGYRGAASDMHQKVYERLGDVRREGAQVVMGVGRSGSVSSEGAKALVRVEKHFVINIAQRRVAVRGTISNRSREPLSLRHGLLFAVDLGPLADPGRLWLPATDDEPTPLQSGLELASADALWWERCLGGGLLRFVSEPARVAWVAPRYRVVEGPWRAELYRMDFLLLADLSLWGGESTTFSVQLDVLEREASS